MKVGRIATTSSAVWILAFCLLQVNITAQRRQFRRASCHPCTANPVCLTYRPRFCHDRWVFTGYDLGCHRQRLVVSNALAFTDLISTLQRSSSGKLRNFLSVKVVIETFAPIRQRYLELIQDPDELDRLLAMGAERAAGFAEAKIRQMKQQMGLLAPGVSGE